MKRDDFENTVLAFSEYLDDNGCEFMFLGINEEDVRFVISKNETSWETLTEIMIELMRRNPHFAEIIATAFVVACKDDEFMTDLLKRLMSKERLN